MTNKTTQCGTRTESGTRTRGHRDVTGHGEGHTEAQAPRGPGGETRSSGGCWGSPGRPGWETLVAAASAPWAPGKALGHTEVLPGQGRRFVAADTEGSPEKETVPCWEPQGAQEDPGERPAPAAPRRALRWHVHSAALIVPHLL